MRYLFAIAALLPALAAGARPASTVLTLEARALAGGARVTLADVAGTAAPRAALAGIDLGAAPLPGYTLRITRAEIDRILRARALPYTLAPGGPAAVRVDRSSQPFDQQRLAAVAEQALARLAQADGARIELKLAAPLPELPLPAGGVALTVRPLAPEAARQRRATVWIDIAIDGAFFRAVPVAFELHAWRSALVAARDLAAGTTPACADLVAREIDLTAAHGKPVTDCGGLNGRLARGLAQGEPLLLAQLQVQAAVAQGENVGLQYTNGAITVESRAIALADGAVGERIDVRPGGARQAVRAEVAAPGLVRITGR